ncbi:MAG: hypothetical protein ACR2GZ_07210 [Solirubrobacteraceae bacterium]
MTKDSASRRAAAQRLNELEVQARFARQRYDLYKARSYGERPTSPGRLRELERECARAETAWRFAQQEAKAADQARLAVPSESPVS